jgi:hypothetical protein
MLPPTGAARAAAAVALFPESQAAAAPKEALWVALGVADRLKLPLPLADRLGLGGGQCEG